MDLPIWRVAAKPETTLTAKGLSPETAPAEIGLNRMLDLLCKATLYLENVPDAP